MRPDRLAFLYRIENFWNDIFPISMRERAVVDAVLDQFGSDVASGLDDVGRQAIHLDVAICCRPECARAHRTK